MNETRIEELRKRPMRAQRVWQCGILPFPTPGEGAGAASVLPFWLDLHTARSASARICAPGSGAIEELMATFSEFADASGRAGYVPGCVEVADSELAAHLRNELGSLQVEVHEVEQLEVDDATQLAYLVIETGAADATPSLCEDESLETIDIAAFAEVAAEFGDANVWERLTPLDLVRIDSAVPDAKLSHLIVVGAKRQQRGVVFLESEDAHARFLGPSGSRDLFEQGAWVCFFRSVASVPSDDLRMWHDMEMALPESDEYPVPIFVEGKHLRRPGPELLEFMGNVLEALARSTEPDMDLGRWEVPIGSESMRFSIPEIVDESREPRAGSPLLDVRALEKTSVDLHRMMRNREWDSKEEMYTELNREFAGKTVPPQPAATPIEAAQDLCYEAFDATGRRCRMQLARRALEVCDDCADAWVILGEATLSKEEALKLFRRGEAAGRRALGETFFEKNVGQFWSFLEARPYLRAKEGLARTLADLARTQEALGHLRDAINLDVGDHLGARLRLMERLFALWDEDELESFFQRFEDDEHPVVVYGRALHTFRGEGKSNRARMRLAAAVRNNRHVREALIPGAESRRSGTEADEVASVEDYADQLWAPWHETPGAVEWLEESTRIKKRFSKRRRRR